MAKITIINGPNLHLLGSREVKHYGKDTLQDIADIVQKQARQYGHDASFYQHNAEHQIIDTITCAFNDGCDFIIINPAAFTHTSVAVRDTLLAVNIPFIEIHLSNPYAREAFRAHSYFSDIASGVICGLGANGYSLAVTAAHQILTARG